MIGKGLVYDSREVKSEHELLFFTQPPPFLLPSLPVTYNYETDREIAENEARGGSTDWMASARQLLPLAVASPEGNWKGGREEQRTRRRKLGVY